MKLSLDFNNAQYTINAYDHDGITVNAQHYACNIVVTPDQLMQSWGPGHIEGLQQSHIEQLVMLEPEIILLGTGRTLRFPDPSLALYALQRGIGFEVMDTGSACRTYNVLASEDRNVIAALLVSKAEPAGTSK